MFQKSTRFYAYLTAAALAISALAISLVSAGPHHAHHKQAAHRAHGADRLVVHEWGTFTSLQGSSGVELDGMQHEGEALPDFVHSFARTVPSPFRAMGNSSRNVRVRRTRSKMETPVIYFHTNRAMDVNVKVGFVRGLMSHYYPAPTRMTPSPGPGHAPHAAVDLSQLGHSSLEWQAKVFPDTSSKGIPEVAADDHYGFARQVDAARVRVSSAEHGDQDERFLFYRGLGHINPKVYVMSSSDDARAGSGTQLHNHEGSPLAAAFAVEMTATHGRFLGLGKIRDDRPTDFDLGSVSFASKNDAVAALSRVMLDALVAQGLHGDEAHAMVRTWSHQWFGDEGTRVLYIVPTTYVDRVLPLEITPTPDALVRVFVGRIEYMTPAVEAEIAGDIRESSAIDTDTRQRAMQRLAGLGRFMEPKIRQVHATTGDPVVRERAEELLAVIESSVE